MSTSSCGTTISIDGSQGEGGGQILRNSIAYANLLQRSLHITKIRAGRKVPGLKAQHTVGLQVATQVTGGGARLQGDSVGSTEVFYWPSASNDTHNPGETTTICGDTKTAGSICLLLQAALPCALFSARPMVTLRLKGGTNAAMAPQYDYWERVFLPTLQHMMDSRTTATISPKVVLRGYFPKGGGEVQVAVQPLDVDRPLRPLQLTHRGNTIESITIRAFRAGKVPRKMPSAAAQAAEQFLRERNLPCSSYTIEVVDETSHAVGNGGGILLVARTETGCLLAGSALSHPKKSFAAVGTEAAKELYNTWNDGGCVDEWLQDQLILFMALAEGVSEIVTGSLTLHTQTAIAIAQQMTTATFTVTRVDSDDNTASNSAAAEEVYGKDGRIPGRHRIQCRGIGLRRQSRST